MTTTSPAMTMHRHKRGRSGENGMKREKTRDDVFHRFGNESPKIRISWWTAYMLFYEKIDIARPSTSLSNAPSTSEVVPEETEAEEKRENGQVRGERERERERERMSMRYCSDGRRGDARV